MQGGTGLLLSGATTSIVQVQIWRNSRYTQQNLHLVQVWLWVYVIRFIRNLQVYKKFNFLFCKDLDQFIVLESMSDSKRSLFNLWLWPIFLLCFLPLPKPQTPVTNPRIPLKLIAIRVNLQSRCNTTPTHLWSHIQLFTNPTNLSFQKELHFRKLPKKGSPTKLMHAFVSRKIFPRGLFQRSFKWWSWFIITSIAYFGNHNQSFKWVITNITFNKHW